MVHVAKEMQRQGFQVPLLIGGATTSARHTAVKIAPHYQGITVHGKDASTAVPIVEQLLDPDRRPAYLEKVRADQERDRKNYGQRQQQKLVQYAEARSRPFVTDWASVDIPVPAFTGLVVLDDVPLETLRPYIDWSPFFAAWELIGKYPRIFEDNVIGEESKKLYADAQKLIDRIIAQKLVRAHGVYGFWPANSVGDDIIVDPRLSTLNAQLVFPMLRQQWERKGQTDFRSLADYIAPVESGRTDYLGAFAVTAGHGCDELVAAFEADHDDYHAIMTKSIADRFAEAFAEYLHAQARRDWGFGANEQLSNDELIAEKYRGIRPAFGYPACPDHTPKRRLFDLLQAEQHAGMQLTEGLAMLPTAAVSGLYFAHPQARYFAVDRVTRDQVEDYARRSGLSVRDAERWLAPNLGYDT